MKVHELHIALIDDEYQALKKMADAELLGAIEVTAATLLRDALIAHGYLHPPPELDEATQTLGSA